MSIGESLGMPGGMFPAVSVPSIPSSTSRNLFDHIRAMRYLNAMGHMGGYGGGARSAYGAGYRPPGAMDFNTGIDPSTMDLGQVNALLANFGQHMPENPNPYAVLNPNGFFGRHPMMGNALEGALFGAANTGPADTIGEGITSVARGILGGQAERARAVNQQFSQPFQTAAMVGGLQNLLQTQRENTARTNLYNQQADYYGDKAGLEQQRITGKAQADLLRFQTEQIKQQMAEGKLSQPVRDELFANGIDWQQATPAQVKNAIGAIQARAIQKAGTGAGISAGAAGGRQDQSQAFQADKDMVDKQIIPNSKEARQDFILGGGDPANWNTYRDTHNRQLLQDFHDRWGGAPRRAGGANPMPGNSQTSSAPASADPVGDALGQLINQMNAPKALKNMPHFLSPQQPQMNFTIPPVMQVPPTPAVGTPSPFPKAMLTNSPYPNS